MIEPLLSKQWFVKTGPLAEKAMGAVKERKTVIVPPNWEAVYFEWMNNIRDWCVSRQIWWGHRIPAWYCQACGEVVVARETPKECSACQSHNLVQETDVLDTWFSSALWPFSTLGWPDETQELKTFYPTTTMVTGFDILFFWVARMMMMGLQFMGDVPFRDVYIHALVRDAYGKKMSKSKGNVIDPLDILDQYGTDAFRFTLAALAAQGRDIKLSEERIAGYRHFVNKIWNSARLVLMNVDAEAQKPLHEAAYALPERWILSRLHAVSGEITKALEAYRFNDAANLCYQFVWHEFCDWYLELAKLGLYGDNDKIRGSSQAVLQKALMAVLKMLHPFMPFVTEEIWQRLPETRGSIMVAPFPEPSQFPVDEEALREMDLLMGVITGVRNIRGEMSIPPAKKVDILLDMPNAEEGEIVRQNTAHIQSLARVNSVQVAAKVAKPEASATAVFGENQVHVLLKGLLDFQEEQRRLKKEIKKIEKDMESAAKKLSNKQFMDKAPEDVIEKVKEKVAVMQLRLEKLNHNLNFFASIDD
jgi:valyl-tRNA synthetase